MFAVELTRIAGRQFAQPPRIKPDYLERSGLPSNCLRTEVTGSPRNGPTRLLPHRSCMPLVRIAVGFVPTNSLPNSSQQCVNDADCIYFPSYIPLRVFHVSRPLDYQTCRALPKRACFSVEDNSGRIFRLLDYVLGYAYDLSSLQGKESYHHRL